MTPNFKYLSYSCINFRSMYLAIPSSELLYQKFNYTTIATFNTSNNNQKQVHKFTFEILRKNANIAKLDNEPLQELPPSCRFPMLSVVIRA